MKIAQIAPLTEAVPPKLYGGTERIVSYLTDELVRGGHEVTLFASAGSKTKAKLVSCCDMPLRFNPAVSNPLPYHVAMIDTVFGCAEQFDIMHFHIDFLQAPFYRDYPDKILTTLHGRLDLPELVPFYATFSDLPLISISNEQRRPLPSANWISTIYHGLPRANFTFSSAPKTGGYLAFVGRISPEKRPDRAIEIAARAGMPLKIAAKIDRVDEDYWRETIAPLVRAHSNVEFLGEIREEEKSAFFGDAYALIFPIDWPEPFGLVMIEAMACGTPVIAFRRGSVPEVVDEGVTGFIVDSIEAATRALDRIAYLDRRTVRATFERRFSVERMVRDYLSAYCHLSGMSSMQLMQPDHQRMGLEVLV